MSVDHAEAAGNGPAESTELTGSTELMESVAAITTAEATATRYYSTAPGYRVNVRSGPGTGYPIVKVLPEGTNVAVNCQSPGTWITGPYGTSNIWDNIANGQFVSDAYVNTGSDGYIRPRCA